MTRIARIFTDLCASAQSVFYRNPSAFICVYLRLIFVSLSDKIQKIQFKLFPIINENGSVQGCQKINESAYYHQIHSWLNLLENKPQMNADERRFVNLNIQHSSEVYPVNGLIKSPQSTQRTQSSVFFECSVVIYPFSRMKSKCLSSLLTDDIWRNL